MASESNLHEIQKIILKRVGYEGQKSFSDIKGDIESNKLAFHLKKLCERGLIEKVDGGYQTTSDGRELLPYFDLENIRHPIIVVDLLVFSEGKVYLTPKEEDPLDPFAGDYRAPSTRIGKNQRLEETAESIFRKQFGKKPEKVEEAAVFDSEVNFADGSKQHYLLYFFTAKAEELNEERLFKIEEIENINVLPGLDEVIKKVKWNDSLFMGRWDIKQVDEGFEVKEFSI